MQYALQYLVVVDGIEVGSSEDVTEVLTQLKIELDGSLGRYKAWGEERYGQKWSAEVLSGTIMPSLQGGGD